MFNSGSPKLLEYWESWQSRNKTQLKPAIKSNTILFTPIKTVITDHFRINYSLNARVIYRTVQKGFGKESPDNLAPKNVDTRNITVFVDFNDQNISLDNINRIIAFPDTHAQSFPEIPNPKLHKRKIDIDALSSIYKFSDVDELLSDFPLRFNIAIK